MHSIPMKQRLLPLLLSILFLAVTLLPAAEPGTPEQLPLWEGTPPSGPGPEVPGKPSITVHLPKNPVGSALLICPGGGYGGLVTGAEGHGIAQWLNQHGIAGIVLQYRLPKGNAFVPLADARRAMRIVRAHAAEWKIDPKKVGVIGFSAGGHLASTLATHTEAENPATPDPLERFPARPDFQILVYPVITMGVGTHGGSRRNLLGENPSPEEIRRFSNETQVTRDTPPAYLAHAVDDRAVPIQHSLHFHQAMLQAGAPSTLLELPSGGHGLNGYKGPSWDAWQNGSLEWLSSRGFAPAKSAQ